MVGTKQSFRSVGRQRITEKMICKIANGGGGTNIKESKRVMLLLESVAVNGCNTKGHTTGYLKRAFCLLP